MKQERIKDRVLKRAARSWGFSDAEMENSFDPIVAMMLNALSYELEKISHELEDSKTRVVERVLEIMFPEVISGVNPARAILHALPIENNIKVSLHNQMVINKKFHNANNPLAPIAKEIAFSPTIEVKLSSCEVKYVGFERNLYQVSNLFYKDAVLDYAHTFPSGEVFLGIELNNSNILELEDLMLYIDINSHQKEIFQYYLKQMKCFYDDVEIEVQQGYNVSSQCVDIEGIINRNYSHLSKTVQDVNEFYYDNFYTLKGVLKFKDISEYTKEFKSFEAVTQSNSNPLIWIKMVFPESLIPQIISNISFTANCFPVINTKKHSVIKTLGSFLSFIALDTDDNIYMDIDTVPDSSNNHYEIKEFANEELEEGHAVVRTGGVSRFDSRSASELLQNVLDLLKDESSSFSGLGKDFMSASLVEIKQLLSSVEQQAKENSFSKNSDPYLMIKPKNDENAGKAFVVNYWSTCAEDGNDIKAGSILESKQDLFFISQKVILMTNSVGGRNKQNNKDRIFAYRNVLLTRGRIVTFADIKAFGFFYFKNYITEIKIEKGTRKEISVKAGFSRTVDIFITTNPIVKETLAAEEWSYLCESFIRSLKSKSSNVIPYRLFVDS